MISREEFEKGVKDLVSKDKDNPNLQYLSNSYGAKAIIFGIVGLLGIFAWIPLTFGLKTVFGPLLLVFSVISLVTSISRSININKAQKYYENNYLDKVINLVLKDIKFSFSSKEYISSEIFDESKFVIGYDRYKGSDLLTINIPNDDNSESNNNLILCDLIVEEKHEDRDGDTHWSTVFGGIFGYVDFPCEFKCNLFLNVHSFGISFKLEKVELEDIEFNKNFSVYSSDQIESRYILTPIMMEKLLKLKEKAGNIRVTIIKDKLYVGFDDLNLFVMNSVQNGNIESMFMGFYDVIEIIIGLVEEIKNNNKVFKI